MFGRAQKRKEKHIAPDLLSAYLDRQVTPQEHGRVEQHLRACAVCARELDTLRYTTGLLRATPRVSVPRAFTLSEADVGRAAVRRRARRFSAYLQGATAVVAVLLLVVVVGDVLRAPMRYEAPPPMVAEKVVVETVVVEAEMVQDTGIKAVEETQETDRAGEQISEKPAEAKMQALAATPMVAERVVVETVVVEEVVVVEEEMVRDTGIKAVEKTQETDRAGEQISEKPAEAKMQALAATPTGEPRAVGGGQPEADEPAAAVTVAALRDEEPSREPVPPPEQPKPSTPPAPAAAREKEKEGETAVSLAAAPTPAPLPQPTPAHLGEATRPSSWWTLPRLVEIALAGLLVILLGLSLWLRRRR